ncbi:PAM68 family protein [Vulcanococcus sp.]|jgi:hypothetical protein|uniref:PAM68 family protein n=1 Tax=Vulcanococcus sp. TaxID=2856995 RepID=UPI0037DA6D16
MAGKGKNRTSGGGGLGPQPPASLNKTKAKAQQTIPDYVANRMARRVAIATGIPSILGMSTFVASYLLVSKGVLDIPPGVTLVTSGGFFLLGLVGLSYGVLSASWEPGAGSLLGIEQIGLNISRLRSSIKRPPAAS